MTHQVVSVGADCSFKELVGMPADDDIDDAPALPEPSALPPTTP